MKITSPTAKNLSHFIERIRKDESWPANYHHFLNTIAGDIEYEFGMDDLPKRIAQFVRMWDPAVYPNKVGESQKK